jgi:hypothetical protein
MSSVSVAPGQPANPSFRSAPHGIIRVGHDRLRIGYGVGIWIIRDADAAVAYPPNSDAAAKMSPPAT